MLNIKKNIHVGPDIDAIDTKAYPGWGLGAGLTIQPCKKGYCYETP
jgi:hypothetical protein